MLQLRKAVKPLGQKAAPPFLRVRIRKEGVGTQTRDPDPKLKHAQKKRTPHRRG